MGYFSNGDEGMMYQEKYCQHCEHYNGPDGDSGCDVWLAHLTFNYDECNNNASILDLLIPRSKDRLTNEKCRLFADAVPGLTAADREYLDLFPEQKEQRHA